MLRRLTVLTMIATASALPAAAVASNGGDLDPTFSPAGPTSVVPGVYGAPGTFNYPRSIVAGADGSVHVSGQPAGTQFATIGLTPTGTLDPGFGAGGTLLASPDPAAIGSMSEALAASPGGKFVVAGEATHQVGSGIGATTFTSIVVQRYNADGTPDTSFNATGTSPGTYAYPAATIGSDPPQPIKTRATAVAVDPSGRVVVVGTNGDDTHGFVLRLTAGGTLDTAGFNAPQGSLAFDYDPTQTEIEPNAVAIAPNGTVVIAGDWFGASGVEGAVMELNDDGTPDAAFGPGGVRSLQLSPSAFEKTTFVNSVVVAPDEKVVIGGMVSYDQGAGGFDHNRDETVLHRFDADGSDDASFGTGGTVLHNYGSPGVSTFEAESNFTGVALQPDGRIVAVGGAGNSDGSNINEEILLVRVGTDGSPDPTFGGGAGYTITTVGQTNDGSLPGQYGSFGLGVAFAPNDRIDVTGFANAGPELFEPMVARFYGDASPSAVIVPSGTTVAVGAPVTFDGSQSSGARTPIASYSWDLDGDGVFGDATAVTSGMTFTTPGVHKVSLLVTDGDGLTATSTVAITVFKPILPPPLHPPHLKLTSLPKLAVSSSHFTLPIGCPTTVVSCHGSILWSVTHHTRATAAKAKTTTASLARASFSIKGGRTKGIKVTLTTAGRAALGHHTKLKVPLAITVSAPGTATAVQKVTVTLTQRIRKSKRRRHT
jgi:uncharacterized delta-60 repeat protein